MKVEIIAASDHPLRRKLGIRPLITLHARYPRFIHSELMTHRVFSRNARSSRAVPIAKMIEEIKSNSVVPQHWGKNQAGMQAFDECANVVSFDGFDGLKYTTITGTREQMWNVARDAALRAAEGFMNAGYHKQLVNRLLEPFMWIDTLITATDFDNFFELRCHQDAEPHFQDLAVMIRDAVNNVKCEELAEDDWHMPYVSSTEKELLLSGKNEAFNEIVKKTGLNETEILLRVSAARCARISYKPFDGNGDIESELRRFDKLINSKPMHASPIEHQARVSCTLDHPKSNLQSGWFQYRKFIETENA